MQLQITLILVAIVAVCHCTHSSCPWDLRDPCASAATQAHDGDIAIPVIPGHPNNPNSREKRAATSLAGRLWPGAIVYYTMSNSFSSFHRRLIYVAMNHWENHTCIRFHPRTTQHSYVNFFPGSGCCSYVGRYDCGQQGISLGRCISMTNAVHEIGHAVGFWHEQSRPDRDQYVKVLLNNVIDGFEYNFEKKAPSEINSLGVGYDYNSIMHYSHNSWSKSRNLDTIQSKTPGIQVGAGDGLSPLDIEQANRLYRCDRENPPPLSIVVPPLLTPPPPTKPLPCGSVILGPSGSFNSPGYYNFDYRRNQECAWVLRGPENHRLTLTFTTRMKDRLHSGCPNDYIEVTLAEDLNTPAFKFNRLCGRLTSYKLYASSNFATVYYHTDDRSAASNLRGFQATFKAIDFDECGELGYKPCDHYCHNTAGSFTCSCRNGWFLDAGGKRCFDMNECALGNGGCEHKCMNSAGSFRCECNPGFVLLSDGRRCGDKDGQCRNSNGGCEQLCFEPSSPSGSPTCGCREGYRLAADRVHCLDIDECTERVDGCQHNCSNLNGSYSCSCKAGYQLNYNRRTCNNIDECLFRQHSCTHNCRDTIGSYECGCPNGLRLAADNHVCEDIDECEEGSAGCSDGCRNTVGSYQCFCPLGFYVDSDGVTCVDQDECLSSSSNACNQRSNAICVNTVGSYECACRSGYLLDSSGVSCQEKLNVSIAVHYTYPADFTLGPNEYRAASGPVTVTCTAIGPGQGSIHYQWSSTCRNCPFQSTTLRSVVRSAVHSGDNGTHTCVATRDRSTSNASIDFYVVGAGVYIFRGSPRGNFPPNNGLIVSDRPARGDFRFRIFCRSDSISHNIGEFIGLDGATALTSNGFFVVSHPQPGELTVENVVGSQNSLTASQQGVYTCRIPLYSGMMREFNIGVYPSGFNVSPVIFALTSGFSNFTSLPILTCTSTGSPATTVTWRRDGKTLTMNGSTYQMVQTVTDRTTATYENVLAINQSLADIVGSNFTCTVLNVLGSDISESLQITGFGPVNECDTNNGGCAHICADTPTSYHCSCRSGFTMHTYGRRCNDIDECSTNNGGCAQMCTNTPGSRECSCRPGFVLNDNSMDCTEHLDISISVDYTPPEDFIPGPNEYRAASGPVTVTCRATGVRTGPVSYQWSSTCRSCPFQSAASNSIRRAAVHSGDNGTHTCAATRGESTTSASIDFHVVGAGVYTFRGSPRGNFPANNGLVVSDSHQFRFRIFCRSDSMSETAGEFIGLDGTTAVTSNAFFTVSQPQPGELIVENMVGSQNALTTRQQGVYTCRIPLQSGMVREINVGVYPSGFGTPPNVVSMTLDSSNSSLILICTTTGSPATTVTWTRDGKPLTIDGNIYQMMQTVTNRALSTYENVLSIGQPLAFVLGSIFTCIVSNVLGSDISHNLEVTAFVPVNECEANNGGCEHNCTDTVTSFQCSCIAGYRLDADGKACNDIDECDTNNGDCEQICINIQGSRQCSCRSGFLLASNGIDCTEHLIIEIFVDYIPPDDFTPGRNEYRAASGPVTVTCIATGVKTGPVSYQWSSTCRSCPFQSASSSSIKRGAVHSGDNGTHTCVATRGDSSASASIDFLVVDAGVYIFRGSPRGNFPPNNGLVISDNSVGNDFRFRIFCRSDSMSRNVGEFIGLDGITALTSNDFLAISHPQPGELTIESRGGSQSALTASQQGVYTCRIPLGSDKIRSFNVGVYPSGFNTPPNIITLTNQLLNSFPTLICTSTGSPATTVTWTRDGRPLTIDGSTYQMVQILADRNDSTYENVLTINQTLASTVGSTFICEVSNVIGSDTSDSLQITGFGPVNECETNNGGCEHICTDTATSFQCSCRSGYRLAADRRRCNDTNECSTNNGGCAHICTNTQGSRQCSCRPGFILANNSIDCLEHLNVSISVDYTPPADFTPGPNEYRAASGPVTVTCTAIGSGTGMISYQWSSTCMSCPFQSAASSSIKRIAVHSGDNGIHTCVATRGRNTASASIDFNVVGAGIHIFRGVARGSIPNNGLVISEMPALRFRLRVFCRSDSVLEKIGQFIGPDGTNVTNNSFFTIAHPQPGEMTVENIVGVHSVLMASQQGVYTCRIPIHNGEIREINIGIYPTGFSVSPTIEDLTIASSNSSSMFTCTSTGSPATTVTWMMNGQRLTIDGSTYQMTQTVTNRSATTYENVLIINQTLASMAGQTFTCTVRNKQGSDTSETLIPAASSSCGGVLTADRGNIQSPNWPISYPINIDCEWIISLSNPNQAIRFTFDDMYGISGQPPCTTDYVAVLNGHEDALLLGRFCSANVPGPVTTSFGQARIVFHAGPQHLESHRGFKITYQAVDRPPGQFSCGSLRPVGLGTPFGPPVFPRPLTANSIENSCKWRFIGRPGTTARLRIFYFDIPESDGCSENSLKIYHNFIDHPLTQSETLCGQLSKNEFMSIGNSMSVVMEIGGRVGYRGFHAIFEQV